MWLTWAFYHSSSIPTCVQDSLFFLLLLFNVCLQSDGLQNNHWLLSLFFSSLGCNWGTPQNSFSRRCALACSPASWHDLCFCSITALITWAGYELGQHLPCGTVGHSGAEVGAGGGTQKALMPPSLLPFLFLISQQILNTAARTLKCCNKEILLKLAYSCTPPKPPNPCGEGPCPLHLLFYFSCTALLCGL